MEKQNIRIAYIGGGSRGWAWTLMRDLATNDSLTGEVALYDIDYKAACDNALIGNRIAQTYPEAAAWNYIPCKEIGEALSGADFVVISILPGTFEEMRVDVHAPEAYGIWQAVGDTIGPGGVIRALRTVPMFEEIALAVKTYCPKAWVINYTNPMAVCVRTLYEVFPEIRAFGCCHEVFGTEGLLSNILNETAGAHTTRHDIKVNVVGVNHFTWLTSASYQGRDLFPMYREYAEKHLFVLPPEATDEHWMNSCFRDSNWVKYELFLRVGAIAAAGDRHLSEYCPPAWFSRDPETIDHWGFSLTKVDWRVRDLGKRLRRSQEYLSGNQSPKFSPSGEEGVRQMQALRGVSDFVTNVNLPNRGQIEGLPLGTVVETNAAFTADGVAPVYSGRIPTPVYGLTASAVAVQELSVRAGLERDLSVGFKAFLADEHVQTLSHADAEALYKQMVEGTRAYLGAYFR